MLENGVDIEIELTDHQHSAKHTAIFLYLNLDI